jgi:glycosyltransferase involved in cell wall biosynthesis
MACGTVVVGANSGAIPEVIDGAGQIFPENDAASLAEILHNLAISPETRQELGEKGRVRVKALYTVERAAETVWQVWQRSTGAQESGMRIRL